MHILFLTQWFQPENIFKGLPFAKALKDRGHDVEVLTGFPNYPGGKLYPGYRIRFCQKEVMDGVTVHRVPLYPSHDQSALRRIANYLSFAFSAFLMGPWLIKKPDVIYVYNLVTLGPAAFLLRFLFGSQVIIDVQDLWPESVSGSRMLGDGKIPQMLNNICNWVYRKADQLVVLSPGFKSTLIDRGVPSEKIQVIYNWCDDGNLCKALSRGTKTSDEFNILYAGAMGTVQGLETVLQCAAICAARLPGVGFVFIGDGAHRARLVQLATDMQLDNVTFLPKRPIDAMQEIYDKADVLIVHLKDIPLFRITIPSKTQAYLCMGKPVIMAVRGDAAVLVEQAAAGIVCEPEQPHAMLEAIQQLYDMTPAARHMMGEKGREYYTQNLSSERGVKNFEELMLTLYEKKHKCTSGMDV